MVRIWCPQSFSIREIIDKRKKKDELIIGSKMMISYYRSFTRTRRRWIFLFAEGFAKGFAEGSAKTRKYSYSVNKP